MRRRRIGLIVVTFRDERTEIGEIEKIAKLFAGDMLHRPAPDAFATPAWLEPGTNDECVLATLPGGHYDSLRGLRPKRVQPVGRVLDGPLLA